MCADDALSNYRLGMPAALGVCSVGDGMVDMTQVVRVDWHPVLMKVYWHCVNYCNGGYIPGALGYRPYWGCLGMACLLAAGGWISRALLS